MHPLPSPTERVGTLQDVPPKSPARYVLYWMTAQRRTRANFALDRAVAWAQHLRRPLLVLEALAANYEHASDRIHRFVLDGMASNAAACRDHGVRYLAYVEPAASAGRGLIKALAAHAAVVVTDDHPAHPLGNVAERASRSIDTRLECVDSYGLLPLRTMPKAFTTAYAFRRHLQRELPTQLECMPRNEPLRLLRGMPAAVAPRAVLQRWPELRAQPDALMSLAGLPIDHTVPPTDLRGGSQAGRLRLATFIAGGLGSYADERNHPDDDGESGLSPYLHFGHLGVHEVFRAVAAREDWTRDDLDTVARGKRAGWWGMSPAAEAFLDQVVTWRELSSNTCVHLPDTYTSLASLPHWAQRTLHAHAIDPRPFTYTLETLEQAATHDEVWNAAQRQLLQCGTMHGYLRMLWGKKILEWTQTPDEALATMILLNDKYALDGRDPNSYAGILWCLGRHDRAWGPERPIFGTVRYMSSDQARKKLRLKGYLERFAGRTSRSGAGAL
jgi:deoxyribodipyrimidine photo-lyase